LPYYRKDTGDKVTVHHLLTHTSGIPSYTGLPGFFDDISRDAYAVDEFIKKYCSGDLEFEPGSKFRYNNSGYFILGGIIEEVAGKKYEVVLKEKILQPLGMKNTGYDHHDTIMKNRAGAYEKTFDGFINAPYLDMSLPYAAGSLFSTVEDLYTWDQALYTNKLLSKKMMELMFKSHVPAMGGHYAYGWAITKKNIPGSKEKMNIIAHSGGINGFNTNIERQIDNKNLIVLFNNTGGANLGAMSNGITNILFGKEAVPPKKSIAKAVYKIYQEKGTEEAIKYYKALRENNKKEYTISPRELNGLGYFLLRNSKIDDAIKIFKFNTELYPKSSSGYDSLAEAYLEKGDKKKAIKYYAKALELNPNNTEIIEKLNRITEKK
jgi:tetratricopeptide (TPR) repeat protein